MTTDVQDKASAVLLDDESRRDWFYAKTDVCLQDDRLRGLRDEARQALTMRTAAAGSIAAALGLPSTARPLATGTFHVVHVIGSPETPQVLRSTLANLFVKDRSLLLDGAIRRWLGEDGILVPHTASVRFTCDGAPFDFAVADFVGRPTLRERGEAVLDENPAFIVVIGQVLSHLHRCRGVAAGLIDFDMLHSRQPCGLHSQWCDYVFLNLSEHIRTCRTENLISNHDAREILRLCEQTRPLLNDRPMRLLHGDLGPHNICMDEELNQVVSILDWEDALVGDPLFDLAMTLTFHPVRRHALLLSGYDLPSPDPRQQSLIAVYFLRISLAKAVHRLRFGIADLPGREPAYLRIHRGLRELSALL